MKRSLTRNLIKSFLGLSLLLALASTSQAAANACLQIYSHRGAPASALNQAPLKITDTSIISDARLNTLIRGFFGLIDSKSTTGLRKETKFVLVETNLNKLLEQVAQEHGQSFQLRDQVKPGMKNVTVTDYSFPLMFRMSPSNKMLASKLRFRKYFEAPRSQIMSLDNLVSSESTKGVTWVELKTDHPEHEAVVIKPRMLMADKDTALIRNKKSFQRNRQQILQRTIDLNPGLERKMIDQFFALFAALPSETPLLATTAYVRESYVIALKDTSNQKVDIQITVDREVNVVDQRPGGSKSGISAYEQSEVVVELKIPLAYSGLTLANFASVPGLSKIADLKKILETGHIPSYQGGKLATFKRKLKTDLLGD